MRAVVILMVAIMAIGGETEARTHKVHAPHAPKPRLHKPRAPRTTYRTVRVKRPDGTVMTGYRDSSGTHLRGQDGKTIHCQRQTVGAADIDVACR